MAHRRGGFQKKIDTVHWTQFSGEVDAGAAGSFARLLLAAQHLPETLLRIRGEWIAIMVGPLIPDTGVFVAAGIILVPEGTGATVLWSPFTDGDAPWIWWDVMSLDFQEFVTDVAWTSNTSDGRRIIDSKAMRKIRNTELQLVVENVTLGGHTAANVDVVVAGRALAGS